MSRYNAEMASTALTTRPAFIEPEFAQGTGGALSLCAALQQLSAADPVREIAASAERMSHMMAAFGLPSASGNEKPFAFSEGVAIIPVYGLLINRFPYCWGFVTGYNFIQAQFRAALADPDVTLIAFDVNSCGGMAAGCEELSAEIFAARDEKPSVAIVDFSCYSAAYYLASAASRVYATPTSGVGSIGAYCVRMDFTEALKQEGVKATVVYAGANKLDGNALVPFSKDAQARWQASVDESYEMFVAAVVRNRKKMTVESTKATEASCYSAADALKVGLIDGVGTPQYALEQAVAGLVDADPEDGGVEVDDDPEDKDEIDMTVKTPAEIAAEAATATAVANAVTAERARNAGIRNAPEAAGKGKLASHLADNTSMTVAEAVAILAAAAPETAPVVTPPATTTAAPPATTAADPFAAAMDKGGTPGVHAEGASGASATELTPYEKILQAQDMATGSKNLEKHRKLKAA